MSSEKGSLDKVKNEITQVQKAFYEGLLSHFASEMPADEMIIGNLKTKLMSDDADLNEQDKYYLLKLLDVYGLVVQDQAKRGNV